MQRKLKAKYRTVGPKLETVTYDRHWIDEETKSLQRETVKQEMKTWMVYFPAGHSVRFCGDAGFEAMKTLGYHLKPRLIDMDTGDVVDSGGDPYDFGAPDENEHDIALGDSEEDDGQSRSTSTRKRLTQDATQG